MGLFVVSVVHIYQPTARLPCLVVHFAVANPLVTLAMNRILAAALAPALNTFVVAVLVLAFALSYAALIFSGSLAPGVGTAIDSALIAVTIGGLFIALRSAFRFAIAGPDSNPTAILALVASNVASTTSSGTAVSTVLMIVALATAGTGLFLYGLGYIGAGRVIRYIPQPMIGGFNAAAGVLVFLGAFRVLAGHSLDLAILPTLLTPLHAAQLAVGLAFGATIALLSRRLGSVAVPAAFIGAILLSLGIALITHIPLDTLRAEGWFFSVPHVTPWIPWMAGSSVDWHLVLIHVPDVLVVALVSAATLLLNATGIELLTSHDVDLDREMRTAGIANLMAGYLGAMISFTSFARSAMNYNLGTRNRSVGIAVACVAAIIILIGPEHIIGFTLVFAPAGLLIAVGGGLAYRWLIRANERYSTGDVITIWLIVISVVVAGFVAGILVGLAAGCITFVVRYSRVDAVEKRSNGSTAHSRLLRSQREADALVEQGESIRTFTLRGYIFFGVADRLYRELIDCAQTMPAPGWIILDFTAVTGIDSSAAGAFVKLLRNIDPDAAIHIVFAGMRPRVARIWHTALESDVRPLAFDDVDLAMEWCETELLHLFESYAEMPSTLDMWLTEQIGTELAHIIRVHLKRVTLDTGEVLCLAGEPSDRMFIIESGRVAVIVGDDQPQRIMSIGAHATIGELGLYRYTQRTATIVAEIPTIAYELSRDALDIIESEHPVASTWFHAAIIRRLADRLEYQNELLATLLE